MHKVLQSIKCLFFSGNLSVKVGSKQIFSFVHSFALKLICFWKKSVTHYNNALVAIAVGLKNNSEAGIIWDCLLPKKMCSLNKLTFMLRKMVLSVKLTSKQTN